MVAYTLVSLPKLLERRYEARTQPAQPHPTQSHISAKPTIIETALFVLNSINPLKSPNTAFPLRRWNFVG